MARVTFSGGPVRLRRHCCLRPRAGSSGFQQELPGVLECSPALTDRQKPRTLGRVGDNPMRHLAHRPWPLPRGPWVTAQRWGDLLFAHWPCRSDVLRPLIPTSLTIETFDGAAWIGVVPFRMSGVRLRGLPPLPGTRAFPELNVRTYVRHADKPGVWFFSLDAASSLAVAAGRVAFHLPYCHADMRVIPDGETMRYSSRRIDGDGDASFDARYGPSGPVERAAAGSLAHWLVERYCFYSSSRDGRIRRVEIHHAPWPLQPAHAQISHNTMVAAAGVVLPTSAPTLHFARMVDVRIWPPTLVHGA
jgi:uncharacterized protein YqjF (DUF2071 family)